MDLATFEVYSSEGVLQQQGVVNQKASIDVTIFRKGMYIVLVKDKTGKVVHKKNFVKE